MIIDVIPFTGFFLIWMFVNALLYRISNVEIVGNVDEDYPMLGQNLGLIL